MERTVPPNSLPDFVIVGAPKCGTTALFDWLAAHPRVAMSRRKEPCFWSPDVDRLDRITDPAAYAALWSQALPGQMRGEASTAYLQSRVAIPAILAAQPHAKMIAIVRSPVEMAAARHSDLVRRYIEDVGDFERAWRLQGPRKRGERIPPACGEPGSLQYMEVCSIGDMLERFVANVPAAQRLIILFDDLVASPADVYRSILEFLELESDDRTDFPVINANRNLRSPKFARLHRSLPRFLGRLYEPARSVATRLGFSPSAWVNRFNVQHARRDPLRPAYEEELIEAFTPQVRTVERLLQRDLSHWLIRSAR